MVQGLLGGVGPGLTTGYSGAPWRGSGRSRSSSGYHDSGRIAHAVNGKLGIEPYGGPGNLPITRHFQAVQDVTVAVGTAIADPGWPEAVTHPRLPQNPACGFPALGSSEVDSQFGEGL
jgi:hypothetical protein